MAREIVVNFNGEVSRFAISRLTREKVYGKKRRIVVDREGEQCVGAMLTVDGATVLGPGSTAMVYLDESFNTVERRDLVPIDASTEEQLEFIPSTLSTEQPLKGPVEVTRFLDHKATAVYQLDPEELGDTLLAGLEEGGIYESRFNYAKSLNDAPMFLIRNAEGIFAIVGEETRFEFCRPDAPPPPDVEEEDFDEEDDLDFGMF